LLDRTELKVDHLVRMRQMIEVMQRASIAQSSGRNHRCEAAEAPALFLAKAI
jgi:hypothetical protein